MKKLYSLTQNGHLIQKGYLLSLILIAVSQFSPKVSHTNIAIMLLVFVWVLEGNFKEKYRRLRSNLKVLPFIALFVLYLFGVFYTEDFVAGIKSLETKASLLVFPVVLGTTFVKRNHLHQTLLFFAYTCAGLSLVALVYQTFVVLEKNDFNYFFSDGLVSIMNKKAVYYAMYVAFSILILVNTLWLKFSNLSLTNKLLSLATILFLLLFLFLLASRTSLVITFFILVTTLVVRGIRHGKFKRTALLIAALLTFLVGLSVVFPQTISRFKSLRNVTYEFSNSEDIYHFSGADSETKWNGLNFRLAKWVCALDVIKQHPLAGVGTGDVKNEMVEAYIKRDFIYAAKGRFDPHNQYLDTAVAVGIVGLIFLLICFSLPLFIAVQRNNWLLGSFQLLIIVCALTESMLSSAQGVIFYCFFVFLLMSRSYKSTIHDTQEVSPLTGTN